MHGSAENEDASYPNVPAALTGRELRAAFDAPEFSYYLKHLAQLMERDETLSKILWNRDKRVEVVQSIQTALKKELKDFSKEFPGVESSDELENSVCKAIDQFLLTEHREGLGRKLNDPYIKRLRGLLLIYLETRKSYVNHPLATEIHDTLKIHGDKPQILEKVHNFLKDNGANTLPETRLMRKTTKALPQVEIAHETLLTIQKQISLHVLRLIQASRKEGEPSSPKPSTPTTLAPATPATPKKAPIFKKAAPQRQVVPPQKWDTPPVEPIDPKTLRFNLVRSEFRKNEWTEVLQILLDNPPCPLTAQGLTTALLEEALKKAVESHTSGRNLSWASSLGEKLKRKIANLKDENLAQIKTHEDLDRLQTELLAAKQNDNQGNDTKNFHKLLIIQIFAHLKDKGFCFSKYKTCELPQQEPSKQILGLRAEGLLESIKADQWDIELPMLIQDLNTFQTEKIIQFIENFYAHPQAYPALNESFNRPGVKVKFDRIYLMCKELEALKSKLQVAEKPKPTIKTTEAPTLTSSSPSTNKLTSDDLADGFPQIVTLQNPRAHEYGQAEQKVIDMIPEAFAQSILERNQTSWEALWHEIGLDPEQTSWETFKKMAREIRDTEKWRGKLISKNSIGALRNMLATSMEILESPTEKKRPPARDYLEQPDLQLLWPDLKGLNIRHKDSPLAITEVHAATSLYCKEGQVIHGSFWLAMLLELDESFVKNHRRIFGRPPNETYTTWLHWPLGSIHTRWELYRRFPQILAQQYKTSLALPTKENAHWVVATEESLRPAMNFGINGYRGSIDPKHPVSIPFFKPGEGDVSYPWKVNNVEPVVKMSPLSNRELVQGLDANASRILEKRLSTINTEKLPSLQRI